MSRFFAVSLLVSTLSFGQVAPTAALTGTVTDPSSAAIPSARIRLVNVDTGFERSTDAQSDGTYLINQVPVGVYRVEASADGFSKYQQTGIRLNVNTTTTLDIRLSVGAVGESVTVVADAAMINTQSGTLSQVVQQQYPGASAERSERSRSDPHGAGGGHRRGNDDGGVRKLERHDQHLG